MIPKINSSHGAETRNLINRAIEVINRLGIDVQTLVAEGQLTPQEFAELISIVNGNIKRGDVSLNDLRSDVLEAINNGDGASFEILSIPRDGSVSATKTDFVEIGKNIFNKNDVVENKLYSTSTGQLVDNTSYRSSRTKIPVRGNTTYHRSVQSSIVHFDSKGDFISNSPLSRGTFTTPAGTSSIGVSVHKSDNIDALQIEEGDSATAFEPFGYLINDLLYTPKPNSVDGDSLRKGSVSREKMDFIVPEAEPTSNLFNKDKIKRGYYVNQSNGALQVNASHYVSNDMLTEPETPYAFIEDATMRIAHYDENRVFISGALNPSSPITTPPNTRITVVSLSLISPNNFQFSRGSTLPSYEPYGYRLPNLIAEDDTADLVINLPSRIPALAGKELNIYYDNLIPGDYKDYQFDIDFGEKGAQYERFFRLVPDVADTRDITIRVMKNNQVLAAKTSKIEVSGMDSGQGISRSVIVIGDSTTNNGTTVSKLNDNFYDDAMDISTIGTRGSSPNQHEGRSGWRASNYVNNASVSGTSNPFYNSNKSSFDFSYYMTNNNVDEPDYVIINLGINDLFSSSSDGNAQSKIDEVLYDYETIIASIHSYDSGIKVGIALTIPPNYSQDAFAKDYKTGQTRNRYKRNNIMLVSRMIETFEGRETEGVYIIPTNAVIDTEYNFGLIDEPVNSRNTTVVQRPPSNSGVHPAESGYWQIADAYWFWLKSFES